MSTLINYSLNLIEARKLKRKKELELSKKAPAAEDWGGLKFFLEQREFVQEKMFELDLEEFVVLYLMYWKEFDTNEISQLLSLDHTTVKSFLKSGTNDLRKAYTNEFSNWKKNLKERMLKN